MIGLLRGAVVVRTGEGEVIVDVGGVGYRVAVTPATAATLVVAGTGAEATLYVHTHVREDAIVLYGFVHDDERRCFEVLVGLARRRARVGAGHHGGAVAGGVVHGGARGGSRHLVHGAGCGRKTAARLLIELKSRLDLPDLSLGGAGGAGVGGAGAARGGRAGHPDVPGRGPGGVERARLRPRRDPRCARRPTRRCRGGRDAPPGVARAGLEVMSTATVPSRVGR